MALLSALRLQPAHHSHLAWLGSTIGCRSRALPRSGKGLHLTNPYLALVIIIVLPNLPRARITSLSQSLSATHTYGPSSTSSVSQHSILTDKASFSFGKRLFQSNRFSFNPSLPTAAPNPTHLSRRNQGTTLATDSRSSHPPGTPI